jgi:hypothetical protein
MSAVADAGGAGTAKRAAVDGLRRIMRRLADEQLRLAVERGDQAQRAYASNDADLRSALAVSGVPDLRGALAQRAAALEQLTKSQQAAQNRDPQLAARLATTVALKQQDLFELRSLSDRATAAAALRDQAATDLTQAQAAISHWRSVGQSAATTPVTVRSSVYDRHFALRVVLSIAVMSVVAGSVVDLSRSRRRQLRRADEKPLAATRRTEPRSPAPSTRFEAPVVDLTAEEEMPADTGVRPVGADAEGHATPTRRRSSRAHRMRSGRHHRSR